jgi:Uma2 family endonuclease
MATVPATRRRAPVPDDDTPWDDLDRCSIDIPARAHTLEGFVAWATSEGFPERARACFIDGEILIDMSPEELLTHVVVKMEICRVLLTLNRQWKRGRLFGDGTLITNKAVKLSTEPDGTFLTRETLRTKRARLVPRKGEPGQSMEIRGVPDWVLEVVSKYSVMKDKVKLWKAYHRARIAEYWLVDAREDDVVFQILHWHRKQYEAAPQKDGWQQSRVFGHAFRLDREKDDLGLWDYTLHVRSEND